MNMEEMFKELKHDISNRYHYEIFKKENPKEFQLILGNKKFHNKYAGKRCFILGNGPSLESVHFKDLADEYVFTVNRLMLHKDFKDLKTNFHMYADVPLFFGIKDDGTRVNRKEYFEEILTLDRDIELFFPSSINKLFRQNRSESKLKLNFFKVGQTDLDKYRTVDFTQFIPVFNTVVQYQVALAIYMGFKEIYLLGCDSTIISHIIDTMLTDHQVKIHAYDAEHEREHRDWFKESLKTRKLEGVLESNHKIFRDYRYLYQYCTDHKIKLVNLSETTLIDTIPRNRLENIL